MTEAERDQLSSRLNVAFTDGTLTQDDYQARLDQLFAAQKLGELVPVVEGLPPMQTYDNPSIITSGGQPGEVSPSAPSSHLTLMLVGGLAAVVVLIALLLLVLI